MQHISECITRNSIIINPIPAVIELLGPDYPLYYTDFYNVSKMLDNTQLIKDTYIFVCMDKKKL
jgi:hypothetical protein